MTQRYEASIDKPWFSEGLEFACTGCGECCTGAPGHVWITLKELKEMAQHLSLSAAEFSRRYTRRVGNKVSLTEDPRSYDCIFLKDKACSIYEVRPLQCRTFPWWSQNLTSPDAWSRAAVDCEGIRPGVDRVKIDQIEEQRQAQEACNAEY